MSSTFNPQALASLPSRCAVKHPVDDYYVVTIKGMSGYLSETLSEAQAAALNAHQNRLEPDNHDPQEEAVQEAMLVGSMYGWEVPGIDPACWEDADDHAGTGWDWDSAEFETAAGGAP